MSRVITERCQIFLAHWESLRGGEMVPSLKDYLANPNPALQPNVMILDVISRSEIPIRLFGTALVDLSRADQTHRDFMHAFSTPGMTDRFAEVALMLVSRPCGLTTIKAAITANGKEIELDMITLPLRSDDGAPPCLIAYVTCISDLDPDDFLYQVGEYRESAWVDIGAGVPDVALSTNPDNDRPDLTSTRDLFKTFSDHWFFLRGDALVPKVSHFLNRPIPVLQPHLTILDVESPERIVQRLIGTALTENYGQDLTGENILDYLAPDYAKAFNELLSQMIKTPCGCDMRSTNVATTGRIMELRSIGFPLERREGEPPSVVWFNQEVEPTLPGRKGHGISDFHVSEWIDIGAGVPKSVPGTS